MMLDLALKGFFLLVVRYQEYESTKKSRLSAKLSIENFLAERIYEDDSM
jgi:hypothetical protein